MNTISFAVCGFGRIGKRHAKIIDEYQNTELRGIIDIENSAKEEAKELGYNCGVHQELEQFIQEDKRKTDVVTIATPNG